MPRVGPACAVSKLSGTFDENELELAASPGPRRAGSSIDPTSADKIKKLEAALEQVLVCFTFFLLPSGGEMRRAHGERGAGRLGSVLDHRIEPELQKLTAVS